MFEIIKKNTTINFVKGFTPALIISAFLVIGSLVLIINKLNYGVDFRGGAEIQIQMSQSVSMGQIRDALAKGGHGQSVVQTLGDPADNEYVIKAQATEKELNHVTESITKILKETFAGQEVTVQKVDIVGPKAGAELRLSAIEAMFYAMLLILIYLAVRFDFKYAPGAVVALLHDSIIVTGVFAILEIDFTLQIVGAILAIIGYSVNDTVIVYDRIRETENLHPERGFLANINYSINDTLSRTILTSGATFLVTSFMYFFGGDAIKDFFLAFSLGIIVGTYSSIFIASPITVMLGKFLNKSSKEAKVVS